MDFDAYLWHLEELATDSVVVRRTKHPERLLDVRCRAAPRIALEQAAVAVQKAWMDDLRYSYAEAHELSIASNGATLAFVTQISPGGAYVTSTVGIDVAVA